LALPSVAKRVAKEGNCECSSSMLRMLINTRQIALKNVINLDCARVLDPVIKYVRVHWYLECVPK